MSNKLNPILELENLLGGIVFEKKEQSSQPTQILTLEQQMVNYSNEVLGIKVISVVLPCNYNFNERKEEKFISWLQNKIKNVHASAHLLSIKYDEKLKIKTEKKEPYINS